MQGGNVIHHAVMACVILLIGIGTAAASEPRKCTEPPIAPDMMTVLVREYQSEAAKRDQVKRDQIVSTVTKRVAARWTNGDAHSAQLRALIGSLLAESGNGADFNVGLSSHLEILCSVLTPVAPLVGDASAAKPTATDEKPAAAAARQPAAKPPQPPGNDRNKPDESTTPQPVKLDDTIQQTLQAKLDQADAAIGGEDPNYANNPTDELLSYHSVMFRCGGSKDDELAGCADETETAVENQLCKHSRDETAACSGNIFDEIKRRHDLVAKLHEEAKTIKPDAEQTRTLAARTERLAKDYKKALSRESLRGGGFYGFYAGPSFLLQDGGEWKSGTEIYANFATEAFDRNTCPFAVICRAYFDASFVTPDAFPKEVEDDSTSPIAVFDSKGRLRIRGAYQMHWTDWLGSEIGVGITSPISDQNSSVRAEPRAHIGAHFETAFPDLAVGEVFVGYARDKSWERLVDTDGDLATTADQRVEQRFDRLILDGTLLFPRVDLGGFSIGVRLSADVPWSGDTQSEIRGSILLYYPFNKELDKYRPKVKQAAPTE